MVCPELIGESPWILGGPASPIAITHGGSVAWAQSATTGSFSEMPFPALDPITIDGRGGIQEVDDAGNGYTSAGSLSPAQVRVLRVAPGGAQTVLYTDTADGNAASYSLVLHRGDGMLYGARFVSGPGAGLYAFDPSSGGRTTIATGLSVVSRPVVTENYIWWLTSEGSISRVPVGGGSVSTVSVGWSGDATPVPGPGDQVLVIQSNMAAYWLVDAAMSVSSVSCDDHGTVTGEGFVVATSPDFSFSVFETVSSGVRNWWRWPAAPPPPVVGGWQIGIGFHRPQDA